MNLTSCSNCGVVIDRDYVEFIDPYPNADDDSCGEVNPNVIWYCKEPIRTWKCPVCQTFNGTP